MSWLDLYVKYTHEQESPQHFHFWSGLTVLSSILGRKVHMSKGFYKLYPNLFTVLVAGSARCRKSTAINMASSFIQSMEELRQVDGKISAEKFLHAHADEEPQKSTFIKADELATFLTRDNQGEKLIDVLTKLFDCPEVFIYETFRHGRKVIHTPYISVLAGTTTETLEKVLPDTAIGGGFASRIMFAYQPGTEKARRDFQSPTDSHDSLRAELLAQAVRIAQTAGVATLDHEAREFYDDWYQHIADPEDSRLSGFVARKHDHVLRVAMILCAARLPDSLLVDIYDVRGAVQAIETIESSLSAVLSGVGSSPQLKSVQDKVMRYVSQHGRVNYGDTLKKCYGMIDARGFDLVIDTLIQSGLIRRSGSNLFPVEAPPDDPT